MRRYVDCGACPACMQDFHQRPRLLAHLEEKSARCKLVIVSIFNPLPDDIVASADAEDASYAKSLARSGRRRVFADVPACRLEGPLRREAVAAGITHSNLLTTLPGDA
eukprot:1526886-Karenia_brevis.AAC.1